MKDKTLIVYGISIILGAVVGIVGSYLLLSISGLTNMLAKGFKLAESHGWPMGIVSALVSMIMIYAAWLLDWGLRRPQGVVYKKLKVR